MRIPRSYVERYSRGLNRVSEQGRAALADALSAIDLTGDVADVRERVVAVMQTYCGASSTMAARLAADFYDGLRSRFGIEDGFRAEVDGGYEPEATDGAVRAFAQDLVDGKPVETFVGKCADRLDREVRLSANQCVERNARRDPKRPRWARVPTGPETCEFCIMLASRGFVYRNEDVASHAHANCDCRVVPSWDKGRAAVEGYDPELYYDMWQHPERYKDVSRSVEKQITELFKDVGRLEELDKRQSKLTTEMNSLVRRMRRSRSRETFDTLRAQWDLLNEEYKTVSADLTTMRDVQSRVVRRAVASMRTLGAESGKTAADYFDLSGATPVVVKMVEDALPYVPRDWLDTMSAAGMKIVTIPERGANRSYFSAADNTIYIRRERDKLTVVHEMMHAMDSYSQDFHDDSRDFFDRRTRGKRLRRLRDLDPSRGYRSNEKAYDMGGHCISPYVFKKYQDAYEVSSMGVEYLYRDPLVFARDPDHLRFVLHKLKDV